MCKAAGITHLLYLLDGGESTRRGGGHKKAGTATAFFLWTGIHHTVVPYPGQSYQYWGLKYVKRSEDWHCCSTLHLDWHPPHSGSLSGSELPILGPKIC
jgi:hypothetical protein